MTGQPEAGFLLKHSVYYRTQTYRVFAVNRRISREEREMFVPDARAKVVLKHADERRVGYIAFSPPLVARPANSGSEMEVSFYPYLELQNFPISRFQQRIFREMIRKGVASHLELRALKHLRKTFDGNIVHINPQKGGRREMLIRTGRYKALADPEAGLPIESEIAALKDYLKNKKRK